MNIRDKRKELSKRLDKWDFDKAIKHSLEETSTRDFLINPFFEEILGYSRMDHFIPEFTADMGNNRRKKVDMAINFGKKHPSILVECKKATKPLNNDNLRQLYDYCRDTGSVSIGILTNGIIYQFYSKEAIQVSYHKPFFTFDLLNYSDSDLEFLSLFFIRGMELKLIEEEAEALYFRDRFEDSLFNVLNANSDDFSTLIFRDMNPPKTTLKPTIVKRIKESINSITLNNAIDKIIEIEIHKSNSGIITTDEENNFFNIVKTILSMSSQPMDKEMHKVIPKDFPNKFSVMANNKAICSLIVHKTKTVVNIKNDKFTIKDVSVSEITILKKHLIKSAKSILFNEV